jgi:hypothetical protein
MKKPFKYKRFAVFFGAILVLIPVVLFVAWLNLPLPPDRNLRVAQNKIPIEIFPDDDGLSTYPEYIPYDENSLLITAPFYRHGNAPDDYIVYIVDTSGEILRSFKPPFEVNDAFAFEDGNIALLHYTDDIGYITEYTADFVFLSEKICPLPYSYSADNVEYSNGLFYCAASGGTVVFDRNFENPIIFSKEIVSARYLFMDMDKKFYINTAIDENPYDDDFKKQYYISTFDGEPTGFNLSAGNSTVEALGAGDSEYPLYGVSRSNHFLDTLFSHNGGALYICGLSPDGNTETLLLNKLGEYDDFFNAVPLGGKRYIVRGEDRRNFSGSLLYLCEFTAVYED